MTRSFTYAALVLQVRSSGEANRDAAFLTAEEGIIWATVFGGPKSKLRAYVAPYNRGTLWVYRDPVRNTRKVSDFDVAAWRPGLRDSYDRLRAAGAVAETITASHGGGGAWPQALALADETLDCLADSDAEAGRRVLLRFLWKWTGQLGVGPDLRSCSRCACRPAPDEVVWYSRSEGAFLCAACAAPFLRSDRPSLLDFGPGARRWLDKADTLEAREALRYGMDAASAAQVAAIVTEITAGALGRRPASWDSLNPTS